MRRAAACSSANNALLCVSRSSPTIATTSSTAGSARTIRSTCCTTAVVRWSDAASGSCTLIAKNPLSSVGTNPPGTRRNSTPISTTDTVNTAYHTRGRATTPPAART